MWKIYNCLAVEHDRSLLLLAVGICLLSALVSLAVVQRGIVTSGKTRLRWLLLGGLVTGVGIWTTHFAAMIAYRPGVAFDVDLRHAALAVFLAVALSCAGWVTAFNGKPRGLLGGAIVGIALAVAHFVDMLALRIAGTILYDPALLAVALLLGVPLCALAGAALQRLSHQRIPLLPGALLALGVLGLHFIAMSSLTILPGPAIASAEHGLEDFGGVVITAAAGILILGLALAWYDQERARFALADRERLREVVAALEEAQAHHRASVDLSPQIPWVANANGHILEMAPRWSEITGLPPEAASADGWADAIHPDDLERVRILWQEAIATANGAIADSRYRMRLKDGSYRWYRARARPLLDSNGDPIRWYGALEDVDDQVRAEFQLRESEERYRLASRATKDVIWDWSHETDQVTWSDAVATVLGWPEALGGTSFQWWMERIHPDDRRRVLAAQRRSLTHGSENWVNEYRVLAGSGEYRHVLSRGYVVRDDDGRPVRTLGAILDVTATKRAEEELRWAAHHDPLTKLPNRTLFNQRLAQTLADATADGRTAGLIVLDVDHFKTLNDSMGHSAGDDMLRAVADRLVRRAPEGATVARLGGDEFAIIVPDIVSVQAGDDAAEALLADPGAPVMIEGRAVTPRLSAGLAAWPRDGATAEDLLKSADLALYDAKAAGSGALREFRVEMRQAVVHRNRMIADAGLALDEDRISPYYQPKVCLGTGKVMGFEALLRWRHPGGSILGPDTLLAAFDDPELSVRITDRMLERILADMAGWQREGHDAGRISFNGTPADFMRGDFAERILAKAAEFGVAPSKLELEITETVFIGRMVDEVTRTLVVLSKEGVEIALDDFGTGYASLTHLKQFSVDTVKIDRSFISRRSSDGDDAVIVRAVIDLARNLGIATVAEGVETIAQARALHAQGCDIGQGYLYGAAAPAAEIPTLLTHWDPTRYAPLASRRSATWEGGEPRHAGSGRE